jgi:hypothetical protein
MNVALNAAPSLVFGIRQPPSSLAREMINLADRADANVVR